MVNFPFYQHLDEKPMKISGLLKKPMVYHCIFWLLYFTFNTVRWGHYFQDYAYSLKSNLVEYPIHIVLVYFHLYYILPRFIPSQKYLKYFLVLFAAILIMSLLRIIITYELVTPVVWRESAREENLFGFNYILAVSLGELYVVGFTTAIYMTIDWVRYQKRIREIEKQKFETELDFLKSQLNPHFFFNTLNNIYSLTLEKSDMAPEVVIKLSELMNYMLYEASNTRKASLFKEIIHLQNYIDLERLRFGSRLDLEFNISGEIEGRVISPLILLPFVENTFKHGVNNKLRQIKIDINLEVKENKLIFEVENFKLKEQEGNNFPTLNNHTYQGGIGLKNTRRRLDLLFEKDYTLDIKDEEDRFKVTLKIPVE